MIARFDLVAFDVDGTLITHPDGKTVWEVLNRRFLGDDEINRERYAAFLAGELSYPDWVSLDASGWRDAGATRASMIEALDDLRLVDGAREALAAIRNAGAATVVISGTLDLLLATRIPDPTFDEVYTNRVRFDDAGRIAGWDATPYDNDGKAVALHAIARRRGLDPARCAFVGDSSNDVAVAEAAGFTIAFNPRSDALERAADVVIRSGDLRSILPHLIAD